MTLRFPSIATGRCWREACGEYGDQSLGLAVDRDGILVMYDPRNMRLNLWREDGTLLPIFHSTGQLFTGGALQPDDAGNTYIKVMLEEPKPGEAWKIGLARLDRQGRIISGFSGSYAISVAKPGGPALRIERNGTRIPVAANERRNFQELADAMRNNPNVRNPSPPRSVPGEKPFWRALYLDLDGRLWVELHNQGEQFEPGPQRAPPDAPPPPAIRWRERGVWDVFQRDGTYLGQLQLPRRATLLDAKGSRIWTLLRGEDDEEYIVKYRIEAAR